MENTSLQSIFLRYLAGDVERNLERFDESTGRFMTGNGWAVTNQDLIFPLALLYKTDADEESNPFYGDKKIRDFAFRGGDALRDFQNPDGTVEFIKVDGSTWGDIYMPWSMYHWLEAYALLEDDLDAERKSRWNDGLTLAYDGIYAELDEAKVHNIPVWNAMAIYRAGRIFNREDWKVRGSAFIAGAVGAQEEPGYWKEHGGPTPSYNLVYVHALGLYYFFSGDETVLPCLERATDFRIRYTYPDGTCIETIDGRVKYSGAISDTALSAYSLFPRGRRFARFLTTQIELKKKSSTEPQLGLSARLASAFQHCREGSDEDISFDMGSYRIHDEGISLQRFADGWFSCLSGFVTPPVGERWGLDRQSFFSLWHEGRGLFIGGGNSKNQPEWSTFTIGADESALYIPERAELTADEQVDRVSLYYGSHRCELAVTAPLKGKLEIRMSGPAGVAAVGRLLMRLKPGEIIKTAKGGEFAVGTAALRLDYKTAGDWIEAAGVKLFLPQGAELNWPVFPFNPYTADGSAPIHYAVAILSADVSGKDIVFYIEA